MYKPSFKLKLIEDIIVNLSVKDTFSECLTLSFKNLRIKEENWKRLEVFHFPDGFRSFIESYIKIVNVELIKVNKKRIKDFSTSKKIHNLVFSRLEILNRNKVSNKKIYKFLCLPKNIIFGKNILYNISDEIWFIAGDKSLDLNFYTKRLILMGVYFSTFNFWINDSSKKMQKTNDFLKKQLNKTSLIGKYKFLAKKYIKRLF